MQSVKPLRLKRESYRSKSATATNIFVKVWVDSGLSHLDGTYSYRIPNQFKEIISIGSRIKVPFNSRSCEALVIELLETQESIEHLKIIESVLGDTPVTTPAMLDFYALMAQYWASDPYSLIKSGIPSRVAAVEKRIELSIKSDSQKNLLNRRKTQKTYLMHNPHKSAHADILDLALTRLKSGSTLLLLPDTKDVDRIMDLVSESNLSNLVLRLDSALPRAQRYENYLRTLSADNALIVGNRNALFAPVKNLDSIIVAFEKSEQYFERKHPFWNVRESVLLRAQAENVNVYFTGYVPSSMMADLIEKRTVDFVSQKISLKTSTYPQVHGELLPDRIIPNIRKALLEGTVLFLVPRKGYGNALLCAKCKNTSVCECGGRHILTSATANPLCSLCSLEQKNWKCQWCESTTRYVSARGIDRFHEEIGRAFPNTPIQISSAPNILSDIADKTKIVIATAGAVPNRTQNYSAVVLLEGQRFLSASTSVYEELVYEHFFEAASHVSRKGSILIVLDSFHPLVAALTRWNPSTLIKKILRENLEAFLPPYASIAVITSEPSEALSLRSGFTKSIKDGRLPTESKVFLIEGEKAATSRIVLSVPVEQRKILATFLLELSRRRAISKKSSISIALDPYTLLS